MRMTRDQPQVPLDLLILMDRHPLCAIMGAIMALILKLMACVLLQDRAAVI